MVSPRVVKLADQVKVIVAEMLERRIKDPRLGFVTVTDVRLTGDSREATVFYTVLGSEAERAGTAAALRSATGLIRSQGSPFSTSPPAGPHIRWSGASGGWPGPARLGTPARWTRWPPGC